MSNRKIDGATSAEAVVSPPAGPEATTQCPTWKKKKKKTKKAEAAAVSPTTGPEASVKKAEAEVSPPSGLEALAWCLIQKKKEKTKNAEAAAVSLPAGLEVSTKKEETGVNPPAGPEALTQYPTRKGKKKKKTTKKAEAAAVSPPAGLEAFAKKAEVGVSLLAGLEASAEEAEAGVSPSMDPEGSNFKQNKKTKKAKAAVVSPPAGPEAYAKKAEVGVSLLAGLEASAEKAEVGVSPSVDPKGSTFKQKKKTKKAKAAVVSPPAGPEAFAKKAEVGVSLLAGLEASAEEAEVGVSPSVDPKGSTFKQKKKTKKAKAAVVSPPAGTGASSAKKASAEPGDASKLAVTQRTRRLMRELKQAQQQLNRSDPAFTVELVGDNLSEWHVRLHQIDPESALANDLRELHIPHILLHLVFPENFPVAPPFMRVVEPVIQGGHVIEGGAICMELLTTGGWSSAYTVEALVLQFAATVVQGQGRVAWSDSPDTEYSRSRAEEAFPLMVQWHDKHGWGEPDLS